MKIGQLEFVPVSQAYNNIAKPCASFVKREKLENKVFVAEIDSKLADTAAFCEKYEIGLDISTNCLVVEARRGDKTWYAAVLVLAPDMADINNVVRRHLNARKISFAPRNKALELTKMEYGGVTPVGIPSDWSILVDKSVLDKKFVVIGGGVRGSKMAVDTSLFKDLRNAEILDLAKH